MSARSFTNEPWLLLQLLTEIGLSKAVTQTVLPIALSMRRLTMAMRSPTRPASHSVTERVTPTLAPNILANVTAITTSCRRVRLLRRALLLWRGLGTLVRHAGVP